MPSKRERRRWLKYVQQEASLTELKLIVRMLEEIEFEGKMRRKAIRMSRKRKVGDYIK